MAGDAPHLTGVADEIDTPAAKEFEAWALRPGATGVAYVLSGESNRATRAPTHLRYLDFQTHKIVVVDVSGKSGAPGDGEVFSPAWSPDGTALAYKVREKSSVRIHVWRPGARADTVLAKGSNYGEILWSPSGRTLYFIAERGNLQVEEARIRRSFITAEQGKPSHACPAKPGSVTVLVSDDSHSRVGRPEDGNFLPDAAVVAADALTGAVQTLLSVRGVSVISLAPDGRNLLAYAYLGGKGEPRQSYASWYIVPLNTDEGPVLTGGRDVTQLQPAISQTKFYWDAAWSPDSKKVAFVDYGVLSKGDVFVFTLATRTLRMLANEALPTEPGESEVSASGSVWSWHAPRGKFDPAGLGWSRESDVVYALRRTPLGVNWRTRLWSIPLNGAPENLTVGAYYDAFLPMPARAERRSVPVRQPNGEMGFVELQEGADKIGAGLTSVDGEFLSNGRPRAAADPATGKIVFVSVSNKAPEEAYLFEPQTHGIHQVTQVNADFPTARLPTVHEIRWTSKSGAHLGFLYVPRGSATPPPLIVQVYPRERSNPTLGGMAFPESEGTFLSPVKHLLQHGYAVFKPDLPVVGGGETCSDVADNLELALAAILDERQADSDRAAIFGASFGGWTVNCVITRTHVFRAAISVAGVGDLYSLAFSMDPIAHSWSNGGGQADIDRSIWQAPDLYWRESPVAGAEHVSTPLLLIHGTGDSAVPWSQSGEMYSALSHLGKVVTLVTYEDADHGSVLRHRDVLPRITAWVEKYLGEP